MFLLKDPFWGFKIWHTVADGTSGQQITQLLSALYTDPDLVLKQDQMPTFPPQIKLPLYPPNEDLVDRYSLIPPYKLEDGVALGSILEADTTFVSIALTRREIAQLKAECLNCLAEGVQLSDQDVISAWWISLLERAGMTFKSLGYTINVSSLSMWLVLLFALFLSPSGWPGRPCEPLGLSIGAITRTFWACHQGPQGRWGME